MRKTSLPTMRRPLAILASLTLLGAASACGTGSTVDNSEQADNTAVPSVSASAKPDKGDDKSKDKDDSKDEGASSGDHGATGKGTQDGAVEEVEDVPEGEDRSEGEENFLVALEKSGVHFDKVDEASRNAVESQIIAAGYHHCRESDTPLIGVAAGQMLAQGLVDPPKGDDALTQKFESMMKDLRTAADENLCR